MGRKGFLELMDELIEQVPNEAEQDNPDALTERAKVYAARMRLQHTVDQADGLDAIREIAANLMGCEELAVYKVDHPNAILWLYWSFGIDPNKYAVLDCMKEERLAEALTGTIVFRNECGAPNLLNTDDPVTGIVPIRVAGVVVAILVIFRLLPQKSGFEWADREICRVLSNCAGRAIARYSPNPSREKR